MKLSFHIFFMLSTILVLVLFCLYSSLKIKFYLFPSNGLIDILRNKRSKNNGYLYRYFNRYRFTKWVCYSGEHLFDLQNLLTKVNQRISSYRKLNKPILFVQHCDDDLVPEKENWAIHTDLDVQEQDFL